MKALNFLVVLGLGLISGAPGAHAFKVNVCECSFVDCNPKSIFFRGCKAMTKAYPLEFIQIQAAPEAEMVKTCAAMVTSVRWERHPRLNTEQARRLESGQALVTCEPVEF